MRARKLGPFEVSAIGLGCMSLSHAYGEPPPEPDAVRLLHRAVELGYTFFDTAALYGFGANETLVGKALAAHRDDIVLASKCGMFRDASGQRTIDGRPEVLKQTCDDSLRRLNVEVIDLYYLHRWDKKTPIEDSVGALSELVAAGKVRTIGLSEVSAATLRKAHKVHPITAVQTEYSLWTRNPEVAVLDACRDIGAALVAFSPVARGFLADGLNDIETLTAKDIRRNMPRFQGENLVANRRLLDGFRAIAREMDATPAQLALAWVLSRGEDVIPIPGTTSLEHLEQNVGGEALRLDGHAIARLEALINPTTVRGPRYNPATQAEIDTEELAA